MRRYCIWRRLRTGCGAVLRYVIGVRTLFASALVLLACGCADRSSRPPGADAPPGIPAGPDPIVLRIPREGGVVTAYAYPGLTASLWRSSTRVPSIERVVAFGEDDGYLAAVETNGSPFRIDLRLGVVATNRGEPLKAVSSSDGSAIYALTTGGEVTRYTASGGNWKFRAPLPAAALFAQSEGALIVAGVRGKRVVVWRVRPPGQTVADSLSIAVGGDSAEVSTTIAATAGSVGDRIFFGANESLLAVRSRDMGRALALDLGDPVRAIVATPSGDRLFVALTGQKSLRIVDRFASAVTGKIALPGQASALRMDPLGRVLLARGGGDTVYVVSLASDKLQGVVRSAWRGDLPLVLADGAIALARGSDVVFASGQTLADARTMSAGAHDFWYPIRWNGFRPRSAGLDKPVQFRVSGSTRSDSAAGAGSRASAVALPSADSSSDTTMEAGFTVSFAALLNETQARTLATRIRVDGQMARVTKNVRAGEWVYRVVLGPYSSREQADRVGQASGQGYWVFRGAP